MKSRLVKWLPLIFVLLLCYGAVIRLYGLEVKSFWIDEAISAIAARGILDKGVPVLVGGDIYDRAYVFHYIMAGFLLLGKTEFFARLISVIFGLGSCVLIYLFGKEYNRQTGWIAFILSLFLEIFVVYSRQARMYQMEMFMFFLTLFLLYKGIKYPKFIWWSIPCFLIAFETQPIALLLIPVFAFVFIKRKINKWAFVGAAIPLGYLIFRHWYMLEMFRFFYLLRYLVFMKYYLPFVLIAVIGFFLNLKKRLNWIMAYCVGSILFVNSFQTLFAYRYIYLAFFPLVILSASAFSKIKWKWVVLGAYVIWLSNIVNPIAYSFIITPEHYIIHTDRTEPRSDFRGLYQSLKVGYNNETLIATFTPAADWYFKAPDYWIAFSFSGTPVNWNNTWQLHQGKDAYTGAKVIFDLEEFEKVRNGSIIIVDDWSALRINPFILESVYNCSKIISKEKINAFRCP